MRTRSSAKRKPTKDTDPQPALPVQKRRRIPRSAKKALAKDSRKAEQSTSKTSTSQQLTDGTSSSVEEQKQEPMPQTMNQTVKVIRSSKSGPKPKAKPLSKKRKKSLEITPVPLRFTFPMPSNFVVSERISSSLFDRSWFIMGGKPDYRPFSSKELTPMPQMRRIIHVKKRNLAMSCDHTASEDMKGGDHSTQELGDQLKTVTVNLGNTLLKRKLQVLEMEAENQLHHQSDRSKFQRTLETAASATQLSLTSQKKFTLSDLDDLERSMNEEAVRSKEFEQSLRQKLKALTM